ncbi:MAG: GMC family oxidoreductase N-terminal domain-containing protein [Solirubrobacterales bacterium]
MAPGAGGLPAAETEVPAAEPVARFLAQLPLRTVRTVKLALRVIELLPFPWRFSRMGLEAREEYLTKLEGSRFSPYKDLLLLAKILTMVGYARDERVRAAVGYESRCAVRPGAPEPRHEKLRDLDPDGGGEDCDVVIVGSGAGGAVAATRLAEAGLDVIVLEAGQYLDRDSYPSDPLEALPLLYKDGGLTIAEGRPAVPIPVGRVVGGTTVINSGTCFRAPDDVLEQWRVQGGIPWAGALEDDFADAERTLEVAPPSLDEIGRNGQLCAEGARAIGASGAVIARNAGACVQCSSCPLGCRIDAKRAMHVSYLPRAAAAGARIRAGVAVDRITVKDGRAVGVEGHVVRAPLPGEPPPRDGGRDATAGRPYRVRARAVICAGGALGTPELLLRSRLGGGQVGRNLHVHPAAWIGGRYEEPVRGWDGIMQSYYVDEWRSRGLFLEATFTPLSFGAQWLPGVGSAHQRRLARFDHLGSIGVHLSDRSAGRVGLGKDGTSRLTYSLRREEARTIGYGIARAAEIHFAAGASEVYPQVGPVAVIPRGKLADFEAIELRPSDLRLEAFHPMGTARMGSDPAQTVTDPDGAVRGTEGLYVADAALLPGSIGVNPMITILAFASHVARGLAGRLCQRRAPVASSCIPR